MNNQAVSSLINAELAKHYAVMGKNQLHVIVRPPKKDLGVYGYPWLLSGWKMGTRLNGPDLEMYSELVTKVKPVFLFEGSTIKFVGQRNEQFGTIILNENSIDYIVES